MFTLFYNRIGFLTLFKREISRFMKVYIQTLVAPLLSNLLFLGIFGGIFRTGGSSMNADGYLAFLVPGLCGMGAIFAAFQNPAFSLITQKFTNTIQDLNSYPMTAFEKVLAFVLGGTFRGVLIALMTYIAALFFVRQAVQNPVLFIIMIIVISFIFSNLGVVSGLLINNFDRLNFILSIILTPLVYFGGVFFEISKLPVLFSNIAQINPVYALISLCRYSYTGVYTGNNILICIVITISITLISFFWAYNLLKKGSGIKE